MEIILAIFLQFFPPMPVIFNPVGGVSEEVSFPVNSPALTKVVKRALFAAPGEYHIYIKHFARGERYAQNANEVIMAGSLYKAWLAVAVLDEIRFGRLSETETLSESIAELNEWAGLLPGQAELTEGMATFTVSKALEKMIAVSHNYSAFLLTRKVGNPKVQKVLKKHGLTDMRFVRPPTTSALEMSRFLEKVYRGRFFPEEYSQKMRDLLAGNNLNDGLPKFLPPGTRVEHKTGELGDSKHDCGIVYSKKGDYVICIMTETNDPKLAEARIAMVSKAVYDYFQH